MNDLSGKIVLMTGGTGGIGLTSAVQLARRGAQVVLVGRDAKRTADAVAQVKALAQTDAVGSLLCDFTSLEQVRALARDYRAQHDRLDILVNNAGTVFKERTITQDSVEATFEVNHLGAFLLTELLLDLLEKSAPARIVNVSSRGHYRGTMDFADLNFEKGYSIMGAYGRSKLAMVLYTRALAKRLAGKGVTVNALHPGAVRTNIWSGAPAWSQPLLALGKLFMISAEEGGSRITFLAADPSVEGKSGLYFDENKPKTPSKLAQDDALAAKLTAESARLAGLQATV